MPATLPSIARCPSALRRLVAAGALACAAVVSTAGPARADVRRAVSVAAHGAKGKTRPAKQAPAKRASAHPSAHPSARERAHARAAAASARTKAALHHAPAVAARSSKASRVVHLTAAARAERLRDSVVRVARAQIGVPYVLGGTTPGDGFDCSGLVKYVMAKLHVSLPRTAAEQAEAGKRVARDPSRLRPGDLVTFAEAGEGVSHIGIYVGDGHMVHASTAAGHVIETRLLRAPAPLIKPWRGVRRVVAVADTPAEKGRH